MSKDAEILGRVAARQEANRARIEAADVASTLKKLEAKAGIIRQRLAAGDEWPEDADELVSLERQISARRRQHNWLVARAASMSARSKGKVGP